jgi:UDP-N-acetylmuramoylalanine--D-glutamate ligase
MNVALDLTKISELPEAVPTLIVGLGQTGLSCARYLSKHGVPLAITDSRTTPPGLDAVAELGAAVQVAVGGFDPALFQWAQRLVVSPGVPVAEPLIQAALARGVEVMGDIELFARHLAATQPGVKVAAITGANGKSTVTALVGEMARDAGREVRVGGNIGTPALELLDDTVPDLYVLELSSFQLETTYSLDAKAAVVLNISPDHMDRYAGVADYAAAKQRIYHGTGVMVVNRDDPRVLAMADAARRVVSFGLDAPEPGQFGILIIANEEWLAKGDRLLLKTGELRMAGRHNQANALAALALGEALGLPLESMRETLKRFAGLPHRTQWVAQRDGVDWYNDSKGTNVGAALSAIHGLPGPLVLIAGGQGKDADFSALKPAVADKVRAVVLLGEDAPRIEAALAGVVPVLHAADMDDAVNQAAVAARPGDSVLLSPACASFDMFSGFAQRGEAFMAAVRRLAGEGSA